MARGNYLQSTFLSGEWSPFAQGRSRDEAYYDALQVSLNYIPVDEGALVRRPGTRFSAHARAHDGNIRLIPFVSDADDALVCELTAAVMRFHRRGQLLTDDSPPVVSAISTATPAAVTTAAAHGYSTGDTVVFTNIGDIVAVPLLNRQYRFTSTGGTTGTLAHTAPLSGSVDGTGLDTIPDGTIALARVTERAIPYAAADLASIKWTEEENTLYLFHPSYSPRTVERSGLTVAAPELLDGPYLPQNDTATTLGFSGTSGSITVTASAATGINGGLGFVATDVGRAIRVNTGTVTEPAWSWLQITAVATSTSATATVRGPNLQATTAVTTWRLGAFSNTTGWPAHGAIHEGRLWLAGVQPGRLYASKTFDFFNFEPTEADGTVADDAGIAAIFAGSGRQKIRWLQPIDTGLLVGTDGGEYRVRASSFDDPITPFTIQVRRHTDYGCADAMPALAGKNSIFIQALGRDAFEYYSLPAGEMDGTNVARDSRHLTTEGLAEVAYARAPYPVLWFRRADKRLVGCTYRNDAQGRQVAWHRHSVEFAADAMAGEDAAGRYLQDGGSRSTGTVHSIAAAPFSDAEGSRNDLLWIAVDREDVTCIEYLTPVFDTSFLPNEGFFVDSGSIYRQRDEGVTWEVTSTDPRQVTFYGLDRLTGKSVDGVFRGADLGSATVVDGAVTFEVPEELYQTEAAYETTSATTVTDATLTVAGNFLVRWDNGIVETDEQKFSQNNSVLVSPNGTLFQFTQDDNNNGQIEIRKVDRSSAAINLTLAGIAADLAADGVVPVDTWAGGVGAKVAAPIGGTPYFIVTVSAYGGIDVNHAAAYYKVNDDNTVSYVGGVSFASNNLAIQLIFEVTDGIRAFGNFYSNAVNASGVPIGNPNAVGDCRLDYPLVFMVNGEGTERLVFFPAVSYVEANSPVNFVTTFTPWTLELDDRIPTWEGVMTSQPTQVRYNRGFWLPGRGNRTILFNYVRRELMAAHDAGTATGASTLLTNLNTDQEVFLKSSWVGRPGVVINPVYTNFNAFVETFGGNPFTDIGLDFDGDPGVVKDDYLNPAVFPTDPADIRKPWIVVFPRHYQGDSERLGFRTFLYDPDTETMTETDFQKGKVFDAATESVTLGPTGYQLSSSAAMHLADDGTLVFVGYGPEDGVILEVGEMATPSEAVTEVDDAHIDAIIGCGYKSRGRKLRPEIGVGNAVGAGTGKTRRTDQYAMILFQTQGLSVGTEFGNLFPAVLTQADAFGRRPLFDGTHHGSLQDSYSFDSFISWEQDRPLPGTVTAVAGFSYAADR